MRFRIIHKGQGNESMKQVIIVIPAVVLLLIAAALGWYVFGQPALARHELASAQARWSAHPVQHYRMEVQFSGWIQNCRQVVEVQNEQVQRVIENTCTRPPQTVSDLFFFIASGEAATNWPALLRSSLRPGCSDHTHVQTSYHPIHGYPQHISMTYTSRRAWRDPMLWAYLWNTGTLPQCHWTSTTGNTSEVQVHTLEHIQADT